MNVSFIISTCRHTSLVQKTIDSINALPKHYSYEICIYSPNEVSGDNVVWFKEDELRGPHYGFNYLINRVSGEYIYQLVDDMAIHQDGWNAIKLLESDVFKNRQYKITTLATMHEPVRCDWAHPSDFTVPNYICMRFPVVHISTIKEHFQGYFYHPSLYYHYADMWMGYWLGAMNEEGIETFDANATLHSHVSTNCSYDSIDKEQYFNLIRQFKSGATDYAVNQGINLL